VERYPDRMELLHVSAGVPVNFVWRCSSRGLRLPHARFDTQLIGHKGQGVCGVASAGGMGIISNWWTESGF